MNFLDDENDYSEEKSDQKSPDLSKYPAPFSGKEENVYEFIERVETAFYYNRVREADKVNVLKKLVKGNAETSVSVWLSLDENLEYLKKVYGNPRAIWEKEKDNLLHKSREDIKNWTPYFSSRRKLMLVKVSNFLRNAQGLAKKFEILKEVVFTRSTIDSIIEILPPKINLDIITKETETRESSGGVFNTFNMFKNIQEVLNKEIELEIIASEHYEALAESYRRHNSQVDEEERFEANESSDESANKSFRSKTVSKENERKNLSNLAMRNIKRHVQRIFRNIKIKKNVDKMIENLLSKSKQIMTKNTIFKKDMSIIKMKINQVKIANKNMKAEAKNLDKSNKQMSKEIKQQDVQKPKTLKLDEHVEQEENVKLTEIPVGALEPVKTEPVNFDRKANSFEDLENRLTKLKFFNKTWLGNENVSKLNKMKNNENGPKVSDTVHDNAMVKNQNSDQVDVDSIKDEIADDTMLDIKEDKIDPVFSTKEEIEAFNAWYYQKIAENRIPKISKPKLSSVKTEVMESSSTKQVLTKTNTAMMKVDVNVVIVMMIALIKMKLVSFPVATSPAVNPTTSCSVCRTCLCAVSGIKADQSLTALIKSQGFCGSARHSVIQV